jgi:hypothetical protein
MIRHNKLFAGLAAAGGLFAMSSAHAVVPIALAAGLAALGGAAVGTAATEANQLNHPPVAVVQTPPTVAVVPDNSPVVMGGPPATVEEVIPAPRDGYAWHRGHYEFDNGVSVWVPGHWVAD